ncbi:single-strand DNA-binding protein [Kribbella antiqua]|uniref:Single-stranded DNA-binding protein n=1 Tax=Kribbella antiqua TaxID=2512217 RepID=A0A4R2IIX4_9ACTN|nr:single-stranded DNA-binding protein [Kribbella antiqua]TCO44863.1 single-strand DNA-binding protein [Kribbella antiqua]
MSYGETYVTVLGRLGSDVQFKEINGRDGRASFRLASTPRRYTQGTYSDLPTTWYQVECWRSLAQNAFDSLQIGQPIVVHGRLRTHEWTDEAGEQHSRVILEAFSIGHDLNRGTTSFTKNPPRRDSTSVDGSTNAAPAEATASPYPADEYAATPIPLTPTTREAEAA